jgi:hypothetical protein
MTNWIFRSFGATAAAASPSTPSTMIRVLSLWARFGLLASIHRIGGPDPSGELTKMTS